MGHLNYVLDDDQLLLDGGGENHTAIAQVDDAIETGHLKEAHVSEEFSLADACLAVKGCAQDLGGLELTFDHHIGSTLAGHSHRVPSGPTSVRLVDDGHAAEIEIMFLGNGLDGRLVAHQMRNDNAPFLQFLSRDKHCRVVGCGYSDVLRPHRLRCFNQLSEIGDRHKP